MLCRRPGTFLGYDADRSPGSPGRGGRWTFLDVEGSRLVGDHEETGDSKLSSKSGAFWYSAVTLAQIYFLPEHESMLLGWRKRMTVTM